MQPQDLTVKGAGLENLPCAVHGWQAHLLLAPKGVQVILCQLGLPNLALHLGLQHQTGRVELNVHAVCGLRGCSYFGLQHLWHPVLAACR